MSPIVKSNSLKRMGDINTTTTTTCKKPIGTNQDSTSNLDASILDNETIVNEMSSSAIFLNSTTESFTELDTASPNNDRSIKLLSKELANLANQRDGHENSDTTEETDEQSNSKDANKTIVDSKKV